MKKIAAIGALLIGLTSCFNVEEPKDELVKTTFTNNLEPNQFWVNEHLNKEIGSAAHSGNKACVMTENDEYGIGISSPINKISGFKELGKVSVSFWIKVSQVPFNASFVNSIDETKSLFWDGIPLKGMVTDTNKWVFVQFQKDFPKITSTQANVTSYIWNSGKQNFIVDDVSITYEGRQ